MRDLSVIIPARNEIFLAQTIRDVLATATADTEVIAILDGYWPHPPIADQPRVTLVHVTEPIGQRAATNLGARVSQARYVMKLDAHCAMAPGFDSQMLADIAGHDDWTLIPEQHNLHAFDWVCAACKRREYQGSRPQSCECGMPAYEMEIVWKPKRGGTCSWYFDADLHFQYWTNDDPNPHPKRRGVRKAEIVETMGCLGACWMMARDRYWQLHGLDEGHGSWGQMGTEIGCKSWLSGGAMMTTRRTWFAHMFRTGNFRANGESTWPYPITQTEIDKAREYSRDVWLNDRWPLAVRPLSWLIEHFAPVPTWRQEPARAVA